MFRNVSTMGGMLLPCNEVLNLGDFRGQPLAGIAIPESAKARQQGKNGRTR
jgi:hypothetical protein